MYVRRVEEQRVKQTREMNEGGQPHQPKTGNLLLKSKEKPRPVKDEGEKGQRGTRSWQLTKE